MAFRQPIGTINRPANNSKGCDAVMRTAPSKQRAQFGYLLSRSCRGRLERSAAGCSNRSNISDAKGFSGSQVGSQRRQLPGDAGPHSPESPQVNRPQGRRLAPMSDGLSLYGIGKVSGPTDPDHPSVREHVHSRGLGGSGGGLDENPPPDLRHTSLTGPPA